MKASPLYSTLFRGCFARLLCFSLKNDFSYKTFGRVPPEKPKPARRCNYEQVMALPSNSLLLPHEEDNKAWLNKGKNSN
jgi:hypothetical protein